MAPFVDRSQVVNFSPVLFFAELPTVIRPKDDEGIVGMFRCI